VDPGSPPASPLSALAAAGGVGFGALEAARARTAARCDRARQALAGMPRDADVAVVLLGSWGRGELTSGSDDDVLVVTTGARRPGLRPAMHELAPAFGGPSGAQGTFDDVVTVEELATIGLQEDSNRVLTRRMLVLLESAPLLGADVHRRVLARLLDAYLGGERRDRRPPRFLLNDVVRYWRTVAVDFEAKARAGDDGKWALHPDQVAILNEVFSPTQEQFDHAWAILDAYEQATDVDGRGAVMFGEEMIDEASRKMAVKFVTRGERAGFTRSKS